MFSLDRSRNDTSVMLDLLRAVAAQMVCVGHAISFFRHDWLPTSLPLPQNVGVLLFFIVSGFLITYTLVVRSENPAYSFGEFFIERFSRIYSGLLPAALLVIVVDRLVMSIIGHDLEYAPYPGVRTLISNLLMFQSYHGVLMDTDFLLRLPFGSAGPWWTLSIEWHIYLFVGAVFFIGARQRWVPLLVLVALFFGQTSMYFLTGAFQADGVGYGLFALWLGGASAFFAARWLGAAYLPGVALAAVSAVVYLFFTHAKAEYTFATYPFLLAFFFGLVIATQATRRSAWRSAERAIRFFADYSFSLYLVHYTLMHAMLKLWPGAGAAGLVLSILLANIVAIALAEIGEKHHRVLVQVLKRGLIRRAELKPAE